MAKTNVLDERASIVDVLGSDAIIVPMKYEDLKKFILSKMELICQP